MPKLAIAIMALALAGCATSTDHFLPGQNYSASDPNAGLLGFNPTAGEVKCNSRNNVDGHVPWCGFPKDGNEL